MKEEKRLLDGNGREIDGAAGRKGNCETDDGGHLATVEVNGKRVKVVNTCTMLEIVVHKLEDGRELTQVVGHDFMMVDHKPYMVGLLTEAINTVMKATNKRSSLIKAVSTVVAAKLGLANREALRSRKW